MCDFQSVVGGSTAELRSAQESPNGALLKIALRFCGAATNLLLKLKKEWQKPLLKLRLNLYLHLHQPVLVAVDVKITSATELHSCFSVALGIKLDKLHSVACDISHK